LAIGVEGGFDPDSGKNTFEYEESYSVVVLPDFVSIPWPDSQLPEIVSFE
jgi:ubiquitin carboxyl-terminal hydrolase 5/13